MRLILTILLCLPTLAFASKIPLGTFEQSKLEQLLRNIPSALQKSSKFKKGAVRKTYVFPKDNSSFKIKCIADHYNSSPLPSERSCEVEVSDKTLKGDEHLIKITDAATVAALYKAIPYGAEIKMNYSHERVYGQAHDGSYRQLLRYAFSCKKQSCEVTFSPKEATE